MSTKKTEKETVEETSTEGAVEEEEIKRAIFENSLKGKKEQVENNLEIVKSSQLLGVPEFAIFSFEKKDGQFGPYADVVIRIPGQDEEKLWRTSAQAIVENLVVLEKPARVKLVEKVSKSGHKYHLIKVL